MIGRTNVGGGGGGSGEIHGASIQVTTEESTLVGKACDLKLGNVIAQRKIFNVSGAVLFTDIQEAGEYTVRASDGVKSNTYKITITASDIVNKVILELEFILSELLPIASKGEIIQIGGYNCMCISTNRYIYMYNIGSQNWNSAMSAAQNWSVPTEISSLYDVNSKTLMTKEEADALTNERRQLIRSASGSNFVWLGTENTEYRNYARAISSASTTDGNVPKENSYATMPAFTISRK